jgi:hypothetical protein
MLLRGERSRIWPKLSLLIICLALASGCVPKGATVSGRNGVRVINSLVAVQNIEANPRLLAAKLERLKVSQLIIKAPPKGSRLSSAYFEMNYTHIVGLVPIDITNKHFSEFLLKNDAEEPIRNALSYIFDIDSGSDTTAIVLAEMNISSKFSSSFWCEEFETETTVKLEVTTKSKTKITQKKTYHAEVPETFCGPSMSMSSIEPESFSVNLRKALEMVVEKMIQDLKHI